MSAPHLRFIEDEDPSIDYSIYGGIYFTTPKQFIFDIGSHEKKISLFESPSVKVEGVEVNPISGEIKIIKAGLYHIDVGASIQSPVASTNLCLEIRGSVAGLIISQQILDSQDLSKQPYLNHLDIELAEDEIISAYLKRPSSFGEETFCLCEHRFLILNAL